MTKPKFSIKVKRASEAGTGNFSPDFLNISEIVRFVKVCTRQKRTQRQKKMEILLFRKVCTDPGSDLTAESTEKKEAKGSKRVLTRISRKTRKDTKDFKYF